VRKATGVGKTAVSEYVSRAKVVGITWPIPPEISAADLEQQPFTPAGFHESSTKPLPDWTKVHEELKRRVTLMIFYSMRQTSGGGLISFRGRFAVARLICSSGR
jgi:hypothetical protein